MTAPDRNHWHELLRYVTDPAGQKSLSAKSYAIGAISLALTIAGVLLGVRGISASGWILAVVGALATGIWVLMAVNSRVASKLTGDDLIEIVVAEEGVVVQGGLAVTWPEISEIQYEWAKTVVGGNAVAAVTGAATGAAFEAAGIDTTVKAFQIRLKDFTAVKERAETKIQRLVMFGPMLGDPGYLHVGLAGRSVEEMQTLLTTLTAQAEMHGVPFTRKASA